MDSSLGPHDPRRMVKSNQYFGRQIQSDMMLANARIKGVQAGVMDPKELFNTRNNFPGLSCVPFMVFIGVGDRDVPKLIIPANSKRIWFVIAPQNGLLGGIFFSFGFPNKLKDSLGFNSWGIPINGPNAQFAPTSSVISTDDIWVTVQSVIPVPAGNPGLFLAYEGSLAMNERNFN